MVLSKAVGCRSYPPRPIAGKAEWRGAVLPGNVLRLLARLGGEVYVRAFVEGVEKSGVRCDGAKVTILASVCFFFSTKVSCSDALHRNLAKIFH